jgi:hypothetical protein
MERREIQLREPEGSRLPVQRHLDRAADGHRSLRFPGMVEHEESDMISEIQVHVIARQMFEKHGLEAIAQAAQNAQACENKGDTEEAREWRHIEDAMKIMRGPHQS